MRTYVLRKDLPYMKAGTVYFKDEGKRYVDGNSYIPDKIGCRNERFAIHADYVEKNVEWFSSNRIVLELTEENGWGYRIDMYFAGRKSKCLIPDEAITDLNYVTSEIELRINELIKPLL